MLASDTIENYHTLMRALFRSIAKSESASSSWIKQTYNAMRRFARCHWSPLAVPLPFASTYRPRQILGCTRRQQVRISWKMLVKWVASYSTREVDNIIAICGINYTDHCTTGTYTYHYIFHYISGTSGPILNVLHLWKEESIQ